MKQAREQYRYISAQYFSPIVKFKQNKTNDKIDIKCHIVDCYSQKTTAFVKSS